ncbi:MAG TPA: hypothetical protein VKA15_21105 [Isosphaeraceae bacterium]|nr:hypothetical protein [Isosphaeraceae bacterium]
MPVECVAVAAAGQHRIGPRAGVRLEQHAARLATVAFDLKAEPAEQVADWRGHVAEHIFHPPDVAFIHPSLGLLGKRLVMPAVGHQQVDALLPGQMHQLPRVFSLRAHGLLAHDMEAALQGQPSMFEVQRMRRADNHSIQPRMGDKLLGALGCKAERELLLDLL